MATSAFGITTPSGLAWAQVTKIGGALIQSPHRGYGTFATPGVRACDVVRDILLSAGWSLELPIYAHGTLDAPFGYGYTGFQSHICDITDGITGTAYIYYDPRSSGPPTGFLNGLPIYAVPIGISSAASQNNLCAAINAGLLVTAVAANASTTVLTANAPGTLGNGISIIGQGSISIGSATVGGGWAMKSRKSVSPITGRGNSADITIAAHTDAPGSPDMMVLTVTVNGTSVSMPCQQSALWHLIADDYQACFISLAPFHAGDVYVFNGYLWACAPILPDNVSLGFAAFVMQPANAGFIGPSIGSSTGMTVDCWLQGAHFVTSQGQQGWALALYHSEDGEIVDRSMQALLQPAYVMFPIPGIGQSRVIGYIPNCFLSSLPAAVPSQISFQGDNYRAIASQSDVPGTCWMMTAEKDNLSTPAGGGSGSTTTGGGNPPITKPQFASGVAGVTILGPLMAILGQIPTYDTNHHTVAYPFDAAWVGKTITVDGKAYTVSSVPADSPPAGYTILSGTGISLYFTPAPSPPPFTISSTWSLQTN